MRPQSFKRPEFGSPEYHAIVQAVIRKEKDLQRDKHLSDVAFVNQNARGK